MTTTQEDTALLLRLATKDVDTASRRVSEAIHQLALARAYEQECFKVHAAAMTNARLR